MNQRDGIMDAQLFHQAGPVPHGRLKCDPQVGGYLFGAISGGNELENLDFPVGQFFLPVPGILGRRMLLRGWPRLL